MMNFIKKVTGQGKKKSDCCDIQIREVKEEVQNPGCCESSVAASDSCCEMSEKNTESCCG